MPLAESIHSFSMTEILTSVIIALIVTAMIFFLLNADDNDNISLDKSKDSKDIYSLVIYFLTMFIIALIISPMLI